MRKNTIKLIQMMDDGLVDARVVADAFLAHCSEDEVTSMMESAGYLEPDEDEDPDGRACESCGSSAYDTLGGLCPDCEALDEAEDQA